MNAQVLGSAFKAAFSEAIRKVGMETFKRSSFFGSNDSRCPAPVAGRKPEQKAEVILPNLKEKQRE